MLIGRIMHLLLQKVSKGIAFMYNHAQDKTSLVRDVAENLL